MALLAPWFKVIVSPVFKKPLRQIHCWFMCALPFILIVAVFSAAAAFTFRDPLRDPSSTCTVSGNPDIAGIGTRLAVYLQVVGTTFTGADYSGPGVLWGVTNLWYLVGTGITLVSSMGQSRTDFSIHDGYLMLTLGNGIMMTLIPDVVWFRDFEGMREPFWLTCLSNLVVWLWNLFSAVFWWLLLPRAQAELSDSSCADEILGWILVPRDLTVWLRNFYRVAGAVQFGILAVLTLPLVVVWANLLSSLYKYQPTVDTNSRYYYDSRWLRLFTYLGADTGMAFDITFGARSLSVLPGNSPEAPANSWAKKKFRSLSIDIDTVAERYRYDYYEYLEVYNGLPLDSKPPSRPVHGTFTSVWSSPRSVALRITSCAEWLGLGDFRFRYFWGLSAIFTTILTTEASLLLNSVSDMNSISAPGQLIGFIVGIGAWIVSAIFRLSKFVEAQRRLPEPVSGTRPVLTASDGETETSRLLAEEQEQAPDSNGGSDDERTAGYQASVSRGYSTSADNSLQSTPHEVLIDNESLMASVGSDSQSQSASEEISQTTATQGGSGSAEGLRHRKVPSSAAKSGVPSLPNNSIFDIPKKWTSGEDKRIIELREERNMNWEDISKELAGRDPTSCRLRYQKHLEGRWTAEEDAILKELREKKNMQWEQISKRLPRHSPDSCRLQYQYGFREASLHHGFRF